MKLNLSDWVKFLKFVSFSLEFKSIFEVMSGFEFIKEKIGAASRFKYLIYRGEE